MISKVNVQLTGIVAIFGCWFVALVLNLYHNTANQSVPVPIEVDYILENATRVELDPATGHPSRLFRVNTLEHHPRIQQSEFTAPLLTLYKPNRTWHITAARGIAQEAQGKQVELIENVTIKKQEPNAPLTTLTTDRLTYLPEEEKLETESSVTIRQDKQHTEAVGMRAYLKTKQVDLLSHVRGYYEP